MHTDGLRPQVILAVRLINFDIVINIINLSSNRIPAIVDNIAVLVETSCVKFPSNAQP